MKTVLLLLVCCGAVVALLFAVAYLARNEYSWPDRSNPLMQLQKAQHHSEELEERRTELLRRRALKDEIGQEVIAGRLTLLEAAARFQKLDQEAPDFPWVEFRRAYPGRTDIERQCRQVITHVQMLSENRPGEAAKVAARLEAELQELLERNGTTPLPEVKP